MAEAKLASKVNVILRGGPTKEASNRHWRIDSQIVIEQITSLLEHLQFHGEFILTGVEPRKGSTVNKDLRLQRPDPGGALPGMLFTAQPGGSDTCWLYRLSLPRDTDLQLLFAKMQLALEDGRHMATLIEEEVVSKVVPINVNSSDKHNISEVLKDSMLMKCLFAEICSEFEKSRDKITNMESAIDRQVVQDSILKQLGGGYSRQDAMSVLLVFIDQKLLKREPGSGNMLRLSKDGRKYLGVESDQKPAEVVVQVEPKPQTATPPTSVSLDIQLSELRKKASAYAEAEAKHSEASLRVKTLVAEITNLEDTLEKKLAELKEGQAAVTRYTLALADSEFKQAAEELKRLKEKYFG